MLRTLWLLLILLIVSPSLGSTLRAEELKPDPVSSGCIVCHNGTDGSKASFCLLSQGDKSEAGHIVSAVYVDYAMRNKELNSIESLPAELKLSEGKITCATCHGNEPHEGKALAIDNDNSALCLACHCK